MTRNQLIVLAAGALLFGVLVFTRTVPTHKKGEANPQSTETAAPLNDLAVMAAARKNLDSTALKTITDLETRRSQATNPKDEVEVLKELSKAWNELNNFVAGGYYAEKVADLLPTGEAWAIAGTTYGIGFQRSQDNEIKKFAARKALAAFEKARALEPDTVRHGINEALMAVDLSSVDPSMMPMIGAQKLLELDKKFPNNVQINLTLGRLSMERSGDFNKAVKRLENILTFANVEKADLLTTHYLLLESYKQLEDRAKVIFHYDKCIEISGYDKNIQGEFIKSKQTFLKDGK